MDREIESWMERHNVPGLAACIARGDEVVWRMGYGLANMSKRIPFTPDTPFQIASVSKTITATAVMQLRDRGLFTLDDDVNRFLRFPVRNPKYPDQPITFRHLLTHTSSLDEGEALYSTYVVGDPTVSLEEAVTEYFTTKKWFWRQDDRYCKHAPGTKQCYSNAGFALLGYLVEAIGKQPLEDYLQEHVYRLLDMKETSFYIAKLGDAKQARPYTYAKRVNRELCPGDGDGNLLPAGVSPKAGYNEHALYSYPTLADGMVRTSVNQLANFMIAMMNGGRFGEAQLLKTETVDEMLDGNGRGLAWFKRGDYWGHDGSDPGCSTEMLFNPKSKVGFIVFANADADLKRIKALLRAKAAETAV
jgi:CubicO group peptidase (beta-lactamase class C family)